MSARAFKKIGQNIFDYFAPKTYELNRTLQMKVDADPVEFELENTFSDEQKVSSKLRASHSFARECFTVETATDAAPEFKVETDRLNKFKTTVGFQDPKLSTKLAYGQKKVNANLEIGYDWKKRAADATVDVAYEQGENITLGATLDVSRNSEGSMALCDWGAAVEFRRNDTQTFALKTADQMKTFQLGSQFGIRSGFTGFAQLDVSMAAKADSNSSPEFAWCVGLQKEINESSGARFLYRGADGTGTLAYRAFSKKFEAKLAYNFDIARFGEPGTLQYKVIFGS